MLPSPLEPLCLARASSGNRGTLFPVPTSRHTPISPIPGKDISCHPPSPLKLLPSSLLPLPSNFSQEESGGVCRSSSACLRSSPVFSPETTVFRGPSILKASGRPSLSPSLQSVACDGRCPRRRGEAVSRPRGSALRVVPLRQAGCGPHVRLTYCSEPAMRRPVEVSLVALRPLGGISPCHLSAPLCHLQPVSACSRCAHPPRAHQPPRSALVALAWKRASPRQQPQTVF